MSLGPTLSIMDNDNKKKKDTFVVNYESDENKDESKVEKKIPKTLLKVKILRNYKKMQ